MAFHVVFQLAALLLNIAAVLAAALTVQRLADGCLSRRFAVAAAAVLRAVLHYAEQLCNHYIAFKLLALIRHRLFEALRRLAPAKLEGRDKGNLIALMTGDIELPEVFYAHTVSPVMIALLTSGVMTLFFAFLHPVLGVTMASAYQVEQACRQASIHDFIVSLPDGYDTVIGEFGETLSGGERQRIGVARSFLRPAPLLLLDEPTANLDSLNEAVVLHSIREHKGERTVVLVSHRRSTLGIADSVYEMP